MARFNAIYSWMRGLGSCVACSEVFATNAVIVESLQGDPIKDRLMKCQRGNQDVLHNGSCYDKVKAHWAERPKR